MKSPSDHFYIRIRMADELNDRYMDIDVSRDILRSAKRKNSVCRNMLGALLADTYQSLIKPK